MAVQSATQSIQPPMSSKASMSKLYGIPKIAFAAALVFVDFILVYMIIAYVPYTKIDWDAYMSQAMDISGLILALATSSGDLEFKCDLCSKRQQYGVHVLTPPW
ncbi:Dol-P-Man:Man(5)GlcNAc(2)-PP-Dol alpha-1 3-mannosyltransferase [Quillaja saponaria]|uniref:Dol-P-Man:Man(5)GlcNAc(2)-PP-Dol alpha-1 3-mannosyltransferase n=1 Tax=Quillaja saponaria TaxID=32244 RepID=A0AAD7Q166_QUISA|nr:Dol-P-Man:Man(5)GlcNAc(2)-PP-Dol alpha-1 3-mannosyltransferase [Quillaja saponaria]